MMYRLIILTGPEKGRRITVSEDAMSIGRDASCSVVLDDTEVAKRHALLEHRRDGLLVRDLGTMNKTLVNQREVKEAHLKHGDMIEIGRTRFLVQATVQADVDGSADLIRRKRIKMAAAAVLVIAGIAGGYAWYLRDEADLHPPAPVPELEPVAVAPPIESQPAPVTEEELRDMQKDLADITRAVKQLASRKPEPAQPSVAEPAPAPALPPMEDPVRAQSQKWLEQARALVAEEKWDEADTLLGNIEIADPTFMPFPAHWDPKLRIPRGQVVAAASIVSPKY